MRPTLLLMGVVASVGCGSKSLYSFPGCDDAGQDCMIGGVFGCAQASLAQPLSACASDTDCAVVDFANIPCGNDQIAPRCAMAVRADQLGVYLDTISNEAMRYCASSGASQCFIGGVGCNRAGGDAMVGFCDAGNSEIGRNPDAGGPTF